MTSMRSYFVFVVLALFSPIAHGRAQDSRVHGQTTVIAKPDLRDALAQVPAGQSEITYVNGELTIKANSARLIDVVRAVCNQVGAELEAKSEPREQVVGIVGPGPAKEVLAFLLNEYKVNYAIGGRPDAPNSLASLMIFPEAASSDPKNSRADTQPSQDSGAMNQEAEQQATQAAEPQITPALTLEEVQSRVSQVRDLLVEMQSGIAQMGGSANLDMNNLLKEAEAQVKAEAGPPTPLSAPATNRPRGRSRHLH